MYTHFLYITNYWMCSRQKKSSTRGSVNGSLGVYPIAAPIYDLYRDPREERPLDSIKYGPWAGGQFANMIKRHMAMKKKYPDRPPTYAVPYEGIEELRPETVEMVEIFKMSQPQVKK